MIRRAFLRRMAMIACALSGGRLALCPECGKPDREVAIGFMSCRACFDCETEDIARRWGDS